MEWCFLSIGDTFTFNFNFVIFESCVRKNCTIIAAHSTYRRDSGVNTDTASSEIYICKSCIKICEVGTGS
jgi:hypothetical protein